MEKLKRFFRNDGALKITVGFLTILFLVILVNTIVSAIIRKQTPNEQAVVVDETIGETESEEKDETDEKTTPSKDEVEQSINDILKNSNKDRLDRRETDVEASDERIQYSYYTDKETIHFNTIDNYAHTGAESRIYQYGHNGTREVQYKITYRDGTEINREIVSSNIIENSRDQIIERYIKISEGQTTTRIVEDHSRPIYSKESWVVYYHDEAGNFLRQEVFETEADAYAQHNHNVENGIRSMVEKIGGEITGYETREEEVVSEPEWGWRH